jgi:hypothetical protein
VVQVVDYLPRKPEALSSNTSTGKKKKKDSSVFIPEFFPSKTKNLWFISHDK